ncbi:hypothetical protein M569_11314, partial [Genlisea aurea]
GESMGSLSWAQLRSWFIGALPYLGMISAVASLALNMTLSKLAMSSGTSFYILTIYSHTVAALILFPTGFVFHRGKLPPLTFPVLWRIFLLGILGVIGDIFSYAGIKKSSSTLGSELLNLVPGFTYVLVIILRIERFNIRAVSDIAKSAGTIALIIGASIVTLYKGPAILSFEGSSSLLSSLQQDWILGGMLLSVAALSVAIWYILQVSTVKMYPAEIMLVAIYCIVVTAVTTVVAVVAEGDASVWKVETGTGLVAVLFAGMVNISFRLYVVTWCLWKIGPLVVSLFNPLTIVLSVAFGIIFFHEAIYLGSVAGTLVLVIGFYGVMWGKSKE